MSHLDYGTFWSRDEVRAMDLAFCRALIGAKRRGLERVKVGIFVDDTPLVPRHFTPAELSSGMSSGAALCIEDLSGAHQAVARRAHFAR